MCNTPKSEELEYIEGQIQGWETWRQAKVFQKRASEAQYDEDIKIADEILGQYEHRRDFLKG